METQNAVENNPFLELSSESFNKLDEVFNSDSVKQLLSDSKNLENLAAAILENEAPATSSLTTTSTVTTSNSAPGHVATVQEGLDLVDALDSLVNQLTNQPQSTPGRSSLPLSRDMPPEVDLLGGNLEVGSSSMEETWVDSISLDHSYACVAVKQRVPQRRDSQMDYELSGASSSPTTPQRRSLRQIEKIEKSVLERIKAENQELLKREREEMGGSKRVRDSFDDQSLMSQDEEEEETFEEGLIIDVDEKKQLLKKKARKKKRISETSVQLTSQRKAEDELENVIAALRSENVEKREEKRCSAGRSQRQRRKPKRWDDDEVEVDFSGNASELGLETSSSMKKVIVKQQQQEESVSLNPSEVREVKRAQEVDSDDDKCSEWASDDDPDKLWCVCRQPHNNRFMICCDGCEDWFHGTCVGVTKKQGRICEQEKRKWFCSKCREAGKRDDRMFDPSAITTDSKDGLKKPKPTPIDEKRDETKKVKRFSDEQRKRNDFRLKIGKPKGLKVPVASAEKKEEEKLKKLIKNKKMEFKKKFKKEKDEKESEWEPISKVVTVVRKPEDKKKKFKEQSIDLSFQDLFKAEPLTMKRSGSTSGASNSLNSPITPPTPTTPKSTTSHQPSLKRPSISMGGDQSSLGNAQQQRKASVSSNESLCVTCNKVVHKPPKSSVYCSDVCIEKHVKELLEILKQHRIVPSTKGGEKRVVVIEKASAKLLAGGNAILEDKLLDFIKSHPSFEVLRPQTNIIARKPSVDGPEQKKKEPLKLSIKKTEDVKKEDLKPKPKVTPITPSDLNNDHRREFGSDSIRNNVKNALRETLTSRCNEVTDLKHVKDEDIKKIAAKVEEEMYNYFNKDTSGKYRTRYRSLVFNLKDSKNHGLFRKVLTGKIEPSRLVRMSPEELASPELAKWRERENKHMLEMIKRDAEQQAQQVIVKKTHKGEELIETKAKKDIDAEAVQADSVDKDKEKSESFIDDFQEDTTSKHGHGHVFDLRCDICKKKDSSRKKSKSGEEQPKRVRVELDEPTNKILQEAVKLSSKTTSSSSSRDSFDQTESVSAHTISPPEPVEPVAKVSAFWKGTILMQEVAKFVSSAFKVSGTVEIQDVMDVIQVCGRIAPEQVLDYIKKLKCSSRSEIAIIRFHPSSYDEKLGYDAFFAYLNSRKRYGVVGSHTKSVKDFYILPLPKDVDPPEVLLPFNGPGIEKRHQRQNLLLGIITKSKKLQEHKSKHKNDPRTQQSSSDTNLQPQERSYTPPPQLKIENTAAEEEPYDPANSLTPPPQLKTSSSSSPHENEEAEETLAPIAAVTTADEEPYDPEDNNSTNLVDLLEKITKSTNPNEVTSTILSTIANSASIEQQKQLLNELTNKVEESKKQLEEQRRAAEAAFSIATSSANKNVSGGIPGLDGSFADDAQLQIPNIQLPENLKEILESVQRKTQEQEKHKVFDDPIVKTFGDDKLEEDEEAEPTLKSEPMEMDEEEDVKPNTIIEVNNTKQTDPRLRSKTQQPLIVEKSVSQLQEEELMFKAQLQLKALKDMEMKQKHLEEAQKQAMDALNKAARQDAESKGNKIQMQWKKKKN